MKLVILDRDGVINMDRDDYVKSLAEWVPLPGSITAIARLSQAGFTVAVATNQSGIGRGLFDLDELEAMHARLIELVTEAGGEIAGIFYCPHTPDDDCQCRKPRPGLLDAIARELETEVQGAFIVGDAIRDLEAGVSRGCVPVLVKTGKGEASFTTLQQQQRDEFDSLLVFDNLEDAAEHLITSY
jgi:D-glycero-D-manno-heptose 1,7-bisphosphate phosphatase